MANTGENRQISEAKGVGFRPKWPKWAILAELVRPYAGRTKIRAYYWANFGGFRGLPYPLRENFFKNFIFEIFGRLRVGAGPAHLKYGAVMGVGPAL